MKIIASVEGREVDLEIPDDGWAAKQIREAIGSEYSIGPNLHRGGHPSLLPPICMIPACGCSGDAHA